MIETLKKYNLSEDNWLEELAIKIFNDVEEITKMKKECLEKLTVKVRQRP